MAPPQHNRIMQRWLEFMEHMDLEGLLDLYAPDAIIESPNGEQYGLRELESRLPALRRYAKKMRLDQVAVYKDGIVTVVEGPRGPKRYWNQFHADEYRIHRHVIDLLEGDRPVPAAS